MVRYHQKDFVTLKNNNYKELKKSITSTSETFLRDSDGINEHQDFLEGEIDQSDDFIENPIKDVIHRNQHLDEKPRK